MKLRIILLILAITSGLMGMQPQPQKPATADQLRELMTAERQRGVGGQPTNYLGLLPGELREPLIRYTLERDTAPYEIRVANVLPVLASLFV